MRGRKSDWPFDQSSPFSAASRPGSEPSFSVFRLTREGHWPDGPQAFADRRSSPPSPCRPCRPPRSPPAHPSPPSASRRPAEQPPRTAAPTANNGTITGATRVTTGRFGRALSFDGVNDLVRIPDAAALDLTTGMTLEAWVKPAQHWRLAHGRSSRSARATSPTRSTARRRAPRAPSSRRRPATTGWPNARLACRSTRWSHLAATFDGATAAAVRQRHPGRRRSAYAGALPTSANDLFIGGNSVWTEFFDGLIDEVRDLRPRAHARPRSRPTWPRRSCPAPSRRPTGAAAHAGQGRQLDGADRTGRSSRSTPRCSPTARSRCGTPSAPRWAPSASGTRPRARSSRRRRA